METEKTPTEYFDEIQKILSDILNVQKEKIKSSSNIVHDLGADSLDTVEIIINVEDKFGCYINDEQAESIETVNDLEKIVKKNILYK